MVLQLTLVLLTTSSCTNAQTVGWYHSSSSKSNNNLSTPRRRGRRQRRYESSSHCKSSFVSPSTTNTDTKQHHQRFPFYSPLSPSSWNNKQQQQSMTHGHEIDHTIPPLMTTTERKSTTRLYALQPRADNLVSGLAEVSFGFSLGVLFSELSILQTGCGPSNFSDTLERICYQGVILFAGLALFNRIVNTNINNYFNDNASDRTTDLSMAAENYFGTLEEFTLWQVRVSEWTSGVAVVGAFVSLCVQEGRGVNIDGLSGIDVDMCRAILDL